MLKHIRSRQYDNLRKPSHGLRNLANNRFWSFDDAFSSVTVSCHNNPDVDTGFAFQLDTFDPARFHADDLLWMDVHRWKGPRRWTSLLVWCVWGRSSAWLFGFQVLRVMICLIGSLGNLSLYCEWMVFLIRVLGDGPLSYLKSGRWLSRFEKKLDVRFIGFVTMAVVWKFLNIECFFSNKIQ